MSLEDPGGASFAGIGGLGEQVRELREVCCFSLPPYIKSHKEHP
jgi:26S proteasome regulatory subunit T4